MAFDKELPLSSMNQWTLVHATPQATLYRSAKAAEAAKQTSIII